MILISLIFSQPNLVPIIFWVFLCVFWIASCPPYYKILPMYAARVGILVPIWIARPILKSTQWTQFMLPLHCMTWCATHGPLARYVKLRVVHAPGMLGTLSPPTRVSDPDMHHGTCVTHLSWCMPGSPTSDFLWSRWRGKPSRCVHNPLFAYPIRGPWCI